jgi:hypothetical protein
MNAEVGAAQIGQWYLRRDKGQSFQVTGLDGRSSTIEIQNFDGDVDEIEAEDWPTLPLGLAEAPEDWTGPMDHSERDDLDSDDTGMTPYHWNGPLDALSIASPLTEIWEGTADAGQIEAWASEAH